jgi:5' nucleotidase, deoxy (Pyrimidine), cytosolic type C protein (NT5C)
MHKPKIECIYLDLDGVIADFVKRYKELYSMDPSKAERDKRFNGFFDEFIKNNNFATLDLMPGAMDGINFLRKINVPTQILSSTANEKRHDEIGKQKSIWLQNHGITFNPIFVPGKHLKQKYASPERILIDDTESNISDWKKAGGIGILHSDWATTLTILRMYV